MRDVNLGEGASLDEILRVMCRTSSAAKAQCELSPDVVRAVLKWVGAGRAGGGSA